jgi:hypothetical protein
VCSSLSGDGWGGVGGGGSEGEAAHWLHWSVTGLPLSMDVDEQCIDGLETT